MGHHPKIDKFTGHCSNWTEIYPQSILFVAGALVMAGEWRGMPVVVLGKGSRAIPLESPLPGD